MAASSRIVVAAFVAIACAGPAAAGQVKLQIRDGLVTLQARDASVREILAEWARVGQTRIVNGERVPGGTMNLDVSGVPERKVLDTLLRSVAGYLAAPRAVAVPGGSLYDRIMIMALPRPAAAAPAAAGSSPAIATMPTRGRMGYRPPPNLMVDEEPDEPDDEQPAVQEPAVGARLPGMPTTPPGSQQGQQPGPTFTPSQAAPRPGMTTTPPRLPGQPGGN